MFAENLKKLRLSYGLTQQEMANEIETTQQGYSKWEKGITTPTLASIEKIATIFNIPITKLISINGLQIEDILNAEFMDFNEIPLSQEEVDSFKFYIDQYVINHFGHYLNMETGSGLTLKSGKTVMKKSL